MIEFLVNESWINPQIDFLLFLQNIRTGHFNMLNDLFLSITVFGEFMMPTIICAIVYWCIDLKSGIYLFSLSTLNMFFAQLFKMIACVYRPWVLSDKIHPVEKALPLAAGYSFPSGHSAQSSALFGGLAWLLRRKIVLAVLLILFVFLVGFSRMWLGVHTPQDVVVGLLIGFSLVFILNHIIDWAEKNKNRYLYLMGIVDIAIAAALVYVCYFINYPVDYVNGQLLVNPYRSVHVVVFVYAYIVGLLNGAFLCRRFFPFNPHTATIKARVTRGVIGSILIYLMFYFVIKPVFAYPYDFKIVFAETLLCGFFVTAVYPFIFTRFEKILKLNKF